MKKLVFILIIFVVATNISFGQNRVTQYCFGNGAIKSTDTNISSLYIAGQNLTGVAADSNNKAFFGLIPSIKYVYTGVTIFENGESELFQNYPNPFSERTTISFELLKSSRVNLTVYNTIGKPIKIILDKKLPQGRHSVEFRSRGTVAGIYFYRLRTDNAVKTKTMIISK